MIAARAFDGKQVVVLGLARSGLSAVRALSLGGAKVRAWDDAEARRALVNTEYLADPSTLDWSEVAALVLSPGIPLTHPQPHPVVLAAKAKGCAIIGDVELFIRARQSEFAQTRLVLITGTNGKSTTTALIGHLVQQAGTPTQVGGNIGTAILDLDVLSSNGVYVIEMSSYQLDLVDQTHANVAILLNITPDHLDRHGGMAGYIAAKQRIFNGMAKGGTAIVGVDDAYSASVCNQLVAQGMRVISISVENRFDTSVFVRGGQLYDAQTGQAHLITDLRRFIRLPGSHNWQNVAAAYAAGQAMGLREDAIVAGLASFPGLAHRMEEVGQVGRVRFVNDSKATNAEATSKALACHDGAYVILGGVPKAGGIESLAPLFSHIRKAYLIGEAANLFAATLNGTVAHQHCGDLASAAKAALQDAEKAGGDSVVLLSPACASFDQFENFEARGDAFRKIVANLAAEKAK